MGNCSSNNKNQDIFNDLGEEISFSQFINTSKDINNNQKHLSYFQRFNEEEKKDNELFWGLGIENESYLMLKQKRKIDNFQKLLLKRERYSVDYFTSFKEGSLKKVLEDLKNKDKLTYPIYINSHSFQKCDISSEHQTLYTKNPPPNPKYSGKSILQKLIDKEGYFSRVYGRDIVFDGDSIEFITQNFKNCKVKEVVNELIENKESFITEINESFKDWGIGEVEFPDHNYGLVSFLTTGGRNLGLCNNGTYHINITLPTTLKDGDILNKSLFISQHINFIKCIQIIEGLIIACYGTPDIFSIVDNQYFTGSQRCGLSRYISLLSFKTHRIRNGKQLLRDNSVKDNFWYNLLHQNSPYNKCKEIGFDINFNKFKNHGVEIRFLDWFPEEYLQDFINFLILVAEHSLHHPGISISYPQLQEYTKKCVKDGFKCRLTPEECNNILSLLKIEKEEKEEEKEEKDLTPFQLLQKINDNLYNLYQSSNIFIKLVSPGMKKPALVNYNNLVYLQMYNDIHGKPDLILRKEIKKYEYRTPLIPNNIPYIQKYFNIYVESSGERCYSDEEYKSQGAIIVPKGEWKNRENCYVLGIKEIDKSIAIKSSQIHLYFAHCFKKQNGYLNTLEKLKDGKLLDFEYLKDESNKRVLAFGIQSGKIGAYLGLMDYLRIKKGWKFLAPFNEVEYDKNFHKYRSILTPRVLIIGDGRVSQGCQIVLTRFNISFDIWRRKNTRFIDRKKLLDYDILFNTITLDETQISPFITNSEVTNKKRRLSVIVDISCDNSNPLNPLPIYSKNSDAQNPVIQICKQPILDIISIDNLPSLQPKESSDEFSCQLSSLLPYLINYQNLSQFSTQSQIWKKCEEEFNRQITINFS